MRIPATQPCSSTQPNTLDTIKVRMSTYSLTEVPLELLLQVIVELSVPETVRLKMTCSYFKSLIEPAPHAELLWAEGTEFCINHDIYTCNTCEPPRQRPEVKFADKMLKKKKRSRRAVECHGRFSLDCGLNPRNPQYTRGDQIMIQDAFYVICICCERYGMGALDGGQKTSFCIRCATIRRQWLPVHGVSGGTNG